MCYISAQIQIVQTRELYETAGAANPGTYTSERVINSTTSKSKCFANQHSIALFQNVTCNLKGKKTVSISNRHHQSILYIKCCVNLQKSKEP